MRRWPCSWAPALCGTQPQRLSHTAGAMSVYSLPADGNLYAVGGYDSPSHLATVEKYEPQV